MPWRVRCCTKAMMGDPEKAETALQISSSFPAAAEDGNRRTKARHWRTFWGSCANRSKKAGKSVGKPVDRLTNVLRMASVSRPPSNEKLADRNPMSWKSFIRLLYIPRRTIASSFSATTVSRV